MTETELTTRLYQRIQVLETALLQAGQTIFKFRCDSPDCTHLGNGPNVQDALWARLSPNVDGILCYDCMERRSMEVRGHGLVIEDLQQVQRNQAIIAFYQKGLGKVPTCPRCNESDNPMSTCDMCGWTW